MEQPVEHLGIGDEVVLPAIEDRIRAERADTVALRVDLYLHERDVTPEQETFLLLRRIGTLFERPRIQPVDPAHPLSRFAQPQHCPGGQDDLRQSCDEAGQLAPNRWVTRHIPRLDDAFWSCCTPMLAAECVVPTGLAIPLPPAGASVADRFAVPAVLRGRTRVPSLLRFSRSCRPGRMTAQFYPASTG